MQQDRLSCPQPNLFEAPAGKTELSSRLAKPSIKQPSKSQSEVLSGRVKVGDPRRRYRRRSGVVFFPLLQVPWIYRITHHLSNPTHRGHVAERFSPNKDA